MAYESIKVDIIPGAENAEVLHFSQFDNKRPFFIELFNGADEFIPDQGMSLTLECRKRDGNIVIISNPVVTDNVAEFSTTEQLTACYGDNEAEIKIVDENDLVIGSANFIINVEKSPTCGGLASESEIDNLTQQIAAIVPEVIGDDYYNKTETDALLADKADVSDLPDMTQYYTKTQTDTLLNGKADASTTYTKTEVDNALALKANTADLATVATTGDYDDLINKPVLPDMSQYYTKSEVDAIVDELLPVVSDSGAIATINVGLERTLKTITVDPLATQVVRCGVNLIRGLMDDGKVPSISDGSLVVSAGSRSDYIKVKSSTDYSFIVEDSQGIYMFYYDENKTYISYDSVNNDKHMTKTTPANCYYVMLRTAIDNLTVCTFATGTYTQLIAYNGTTYPVADISTITTLNGVNNIFADVGDVSVSAYDSIQHYIDNQ